MLNFMDLVQNAFYKTTKWDTDNSFSTLNASTRGTLPLQLAHLPL